MLLIWYTVSDRINSLARPVGARALSLRRRQSRPTVAATVADRGGGGIIQGSRTIKIIMPVSGRHGTFYRENLTIDINIFMHLYYKLY